MYHTAAISVSHGYHHCLYHHSASLLGEMTTFVKWISGGGLFGAAAAEEERAADAPKILGTCHFQCTTRYSIGIECRCGELLQLQTSVALWLETEN